MGRPQINRQEAKKPATKGSAQDKSRPKGKPMKKRSVESTKSLSDIKRRVRDLNRFLSRPNLPTAQREDLERQLRPLNTQLRVLQFYAAEKANATKSHRIRFLDRKRINRRIKQLNASIQECQESDETTQNELALQRQELELNLKYIEHYPHNFPYKSINTDAPLAKKQQEIREEIRTAIEKGEVSLLPDKRLAAYLSQTTTATTPIDAPSNTNDAESGSGSEEPLPKDTQKAALKSSNFFATGSDDESDDDA
ncbi:18S rRNA maturation protein [Dimargaris cristalligena]|uniref:rRNA-processing protein EFG1 n=1 Tax=Dimargaris cristalligena TaxID=215637 RepID=A0A4P9ZMD9_9FUNG|nr:18S rRNA maturation protein [Dimargaris cristalligena]RKP34536.1 hypothetical protein BJ085DRAFT_39121 [Dimargaris cristalligena]|eukprot:RKP34536.1 hypothetical protein BJ085DRAFT_39121 [Dimargaris cristalligena]